MLVTDRHIETKLKGRQIGNRRQEIKGSGIFSSLFNTFVKGASYAAKGASQAASYAAKNKDLWAKPLLGAAGNVGAHAVQHIGSAAVEKAANKIKGKQAEIPTLLPAEPIIPEKPSMFKPDLTINEEEKRKILSKILNPK